MTIITIGPACVCMCVCLCVRVCMYVCAHVPPTLLRKTHVTSNHYWPCAHMCVCVCVCILQVWFATKSVCMCVYPTSLVCYQKRAGRLHKCEANFTHAFQEWDVPYIGLAQTIYVYIYGVYTVFLAGESPKIYGHVRCVCGIFGRESTKYTVMYGAYIRSWPTLAIYLIYQAYSVTHPTPIQGKRPAGSANNAQEQKSN